MGETGATNETIHASVKARWDKLKWRPKSLHGFEPREGAGGTVEWVKEDRNGNVVLKEEAFPEEPVKPYFSFEWQLRYAP